MPRFDGNRRLSRATMDLDRPLDLSREARAQDESGTPAAFIEQLRRHGELELLDEVADAHVAVEFPMGRLWRLQTGCARFVRLRVPRNGKRYALVRSGRAADQTNSGGGVRR